MTNPVLSWTGSDLWTLAEEWSITVDGATFKIPEGFTFDLASIPLRSRNRDATHPLIVAGGEGAFTPEPMAEFIDAFIVGDGEEAILELLDEVARAKDDGASRTHASVVRQGDEFVLSDLQSTNGLFVNGVPVEHHMLRHGDRIQVGHTSVVKFCFQDEVEESFQKTLYEAATRDPLVGCYNRRYLTETLAAEFAASLRAGMPLSLMMLDLDHFKQINDTYGHPAGDHALQEVVRLINGNLRTGDTLARYGGEEFALVLRNCPADGGVVLAERLRTTIADHLIECSGRAFRVTVSIGIATSAGRNCSEPSELLQAADALLYEAKTRGRNCVVSMNPDDESEIAPARTGPA